MSTQKLPEVVIIVTISKESCTAYGTLLNLFLNSVMRCDAMLYKYESVPRMSSSSYGHEQQHTCDRRGTVNSNSFIDDKDKER